VIASVEHQQKIMPRIDITLRHGDTARHEDQNDWLRE
jgi:hypothetical protein